MLLASCLALLCFIHAQAAPAVLIKPIGEAPKLYEGEYGTGEDVIEGDIIVSKNKRAGRPEKRWTNNIVYYTMDNSVDSATQNRIAQAIAHIQSKTCVKWQRRTNQRNYVAITRNAPGCQAQLGMEGGEQFLKLGRGCDDLGVVVHEMGHSMGFHHEHNREDRDQYVTIMWQNVNRQMSANFNIARGSNTFGQSYDYGSIMHYGATGFSTNGQPTIVPKDGNTNKIGQRQGLSDIDAKKINIMYQCGNVQTGNTQQPFTQQPWTQQPIQQCMDRQQGCQQWAMQGMCQRDPNYMIPTCPRSCGRCQTQVQQCADRAQGCQQWAMQGMCQRDPNYMVPTCPRSCGRCQG